MLPWFDKYSQHSVIVTLFPSFLWPIFPLLLNLSLSHHRVSRHQRRRATHVDSVTAEVTFVFWNNTLALIKSRKYLCCINNLDESIDCPFKPSISLTRHSVNPDNSYTWACEKAGKKLYDIWHIYSHTTGFLHLDTNSTHKCANNRHSACWI